MKDSQKYNWQLEIKSLFVLAFYSMTNSQQSFKLLSVVLMPLLISGLDFKTKVIPVNGNEESIQIWDTAGQERFRSITQSYFRKVDGIILVYDITHEESFLNLQSWVSCIQVDMG